MRILFLLLFISTNLYAQVGHDTVRVMQYNILRYGNADNGCSNSTAAMALKDAAFKKITKASLPDIIAVNEMASNVLYADRILVNVLNTDGINSYKRGAYTNTVNSPLVNMIFYNSEKVEIHSEETINGIIRDINMSKFYYKDSLLDSGADTVFFTIINGHLKAGSSSSDQNLRDQMTSNIMSNLAAKGVSDNYIALGDYNSRSSGEAGIQNLLNPTNPDIRFIDPINSLGSWNNNSTFAAIHTQSTRTSSGCGAGGGMDDRFDVIFTSPNIIFDLAKVSYVPSSYTAYGQDGNRFNSTINAGTNAAVPDSIADALFDLSDHLPVYLDLAIEKAQISSLAEKINQDQIQLLKNPVSSEIDLVLGSSQYYSVELIDLNGRTLSAHKIKGNSTHSIPMNQLSGMYILHWTSDKGNFGSFKVLKR